MAPLKRPASSRRGIALIEAVLLLPLVLLLLLGGLQYGWCFLKARQLEEAAQRGALIGASGTATTATVIHSIAEFMDASGMPQSSSGYVVRLRNASTGTSVTDVGDDLQLPPEALLEVTVTIPSYSQVEILHAPLLPMPASLSRHGGMLKLGRSRVELPRPP